MVRTKVVATKAKDPAQPKISISTPPKKRNCTESTSSSKQKGSKQLLLVQLKLSRKKEKASIYIKHVIPYGKSWYKKFFPPMYTLETANDDNNLKASYNHIWATMHNVGWGLCSKT